jgi:poly(beta-D-mannuronate) lyase
MLADRSEVGHYARCRYGKRRHVHEAHARSLVAGCAILCAGGTVRAREVRVASAAEISAAMAVAQPGDTLTMVSGIWTDARIVFAGNGLPGAPITLRTEAPGAVSLEGASNLRIAGTCLLVDGLVFRNGYSPSGGVIEFRNSSTGAESRNCRLTNATIESYNPPSAATDYKWISLYGSHNRVDHCPSGGSPRGATLVVWLSRRRTSTRSITTTSPAAPLGVNGGETIRVGTSDWSMFIVHTGGAKPVRRVQR